MAQDARAGKHWPLFSSLASWQPAFLPGDLIAGLTLAAIAIPEQMATARLAFGGFAPQIGFFAFMAGLVGFRHARRQPFPVLQRPPRSRRSSPAALPPVAATGSPEYQALAIALALMVGVMLVLSGVFKPRRWSPISVGAGDGRGWPASPCTSSCSQLPGVLGPGLTKRSNAGSHRRDRTSKARPRQSLYRWPSALACWPPCSSARRSIAKNSRRALIGLVRGDPVAVIFAGSPRGQRASRWSARCRRRCRSRPFPTCRRSTGFAWSRSPS